MQNWVNILEDSANKIIECIRFKIITGLNTFNSKLPCDPANPIVASFPITCTQAIVKASHWVGFTLPGMMEEPGSLAGKINSPNPALGPDPNQRTSLAI